MKKSVSHAAAAAAAEAEASLRNRAARQASVDNAPVEPPEMVTCRVLKKGDGKISMGQHVGGIGEVHYERNETFQATKQRGDELEEDGLAEIVDTAPVEPVAVLP